MCCKLSSRLVRGGARPRGVRRESLQHTADLYVNDEIKQTQYFRKPSCLSTPKEAPTISGRVVPEVLVPEECDDEINKC